MSGRLGRTPLLRRWYRRTTRRHDRPETTHEAAIRRQDEARRAFRGFV